MRTTLQHLFPPILLYFFQSVASQFGQYSQSVSQVSTAVLCFPCFKAKTSAKLEIPYFFFNKESE